MAASPDTPRVGRLGRALDQLAAALPLLVLFALLVIAYGLQAAGRATPWLFGDELEFTQLSRAVAETGELARRGEPYGGLLLYPYLIAPAWLIDDTKTAYETAKLIGVVVMSATLFPAYALARLFLAKLPALVVALAACVIPSFAYTSFLIQEPIAYFWSTLSLYLIVRALVTRRLPDFALAAAACLLAPLVRGQLAVLLLVLAAAIGLVVWETEQARRVRSRWRRADWAAVLLLALGIAIVGNEWYSNRSNEWASVTTHYKDRILDYGLSNAGALAIGLGVLPLVLGLAFLLGRRGETADRNVRALRVVMLAAVAGFGIYAAVKAAHLSTVFGERIVERNLIYLSPLLFLATALVLLERRLRLLGLGLAAAFVAYLLVHTPYLMEQHLYSDSLGLAILSGANRRFGWTPEHAQNVLLWMLAATVGVGLAVLFLRHARALLALTAVVAALVLGWNVLGERTAARAANDFSEYYLDRYPEQLDWVDSSVAGRPALYIGQRMTDHNALWLLEFWNRSLERVWSLDGTAPGPGPTLTPDLTQATGELSDDPGYRYVVAEPGVDVSGRVVREERGWRLVELRPPLRLQGAQRGIFPDGWIGAPGEAEAAFAAFTRFETAPNVPGTAFVTLSRKGWCSAADVPGYAVIRAGELTLGPERNGVVGELTDEAGWQVRACGERTFPLSVPKPPFVIEVSISPLFSPIRLDPSSSESRWLGAQVAFDWRPGDVTLEEWLELRPTDEAGS